jgi:hypothetical protein
VGGVNKGNKVGGVNKVNKDNKEAGINKDKLVGSLSILSKVNPIRLCLQQIPLCVSTVAVV